MDKTGSPLLRGINHDGRGQVDLNPDEDASEEVDEGCVVQLV